MKPLPAADLEHILEHTRARWDTARGARFFLSGATGFFGAWLLESFVYCNYVLDLGMRATVLSRDPADALRRLPHLAEAPSLEWLQGDVRDVPLPAERFDYVLHGAAPTVGHAALAEGELTEILIHGTEHMLALAAACGARGFLHLSSGAVYGGQPANLSHIPEEYRGKLDWIDPSSSYAGGKRVSERLCGFRSSGSNLRSVSARCFAFVGPYLPLDAHFAIGNFIADAMADRPIMVKGDGTALRSYLYAADLAIWLWTMLLDPRSDGPPFDAFNVGSSEAVTIAQLARTVADVLHPGLEVRIEGDSSLGTRRSVYVPATEKAERELGLRQWISLKEAIRRTAAWYLVARP